MMRKTDVACATTSGELLYDTIFKVVKVDTPRPLTPNKMLLEMDPSVAIESLPKVRVRASLCTIGTFTPKDARELDRFTVVNATVYG